MICHKLFWGIVPYVDWIFFCRCSLASTFTDFWTFSISFNFKTYAFNFQYDKNIGNWKIERHIILLSRQCYHQFTLYSLAIISLFSKLESRDTKRYIDFIWDFQIQIRFIMKSNSLNCMQFSGFWSFLEENQYEKWAESEMNKFSLLQFECPKYMDFCLSIVHFVLFLCSRTFFVSVKFRFVLMSRLLQSMSNSDNIKPS